MAQPITISFKDPDFASDLHAAGVTGPSVDRLCKLAEFGEYWTLKLTLNAQGEVVGGKFVKT